MKYGIIVVTALMGSLLLSGCARTEKAEAPTQSLPTTQTEDRTQTPSYQETEPVIEEDITFPEETNPAVSEPDSTETVPETEGNWQGGIVLPDDDWED